MHVRFMQLVDYWVGVPLCFLFSFFAKFSRRPDGAPKKILFLELSEMGSAVLAYSAFKRAQELFPGAELYFMVFKRNREGVELLKFFPPERIIEVNDRSFFTFTVSILVQLRRLRTIGIDAVVDLELFSRATTLIGFLSGATHRVGFSNYTNEGLYRGSIITHPILYNTHLHIAENFLALVHALKADPRERPLLKECVDGQRVPLPLFFPTDAEQEAIDKVLAAGKLTPGERLVLLNPDPGLLELRGWPLPYFCELAARLVAADDRIKIGVVGLARSRSFAKTIFEKLPPERTVDLTGATATLAELVALIARSALLVTADSGPGHFASLTTTPAVVLFGPETPRLYGPIGDNITSVTANFSCSPCFTAYNHRHSSCTNNRCLQAITVERVFQLAMEKLAVR